MNPLLEKARKEIRSVRLWQAITAISIGIGFLDHWHLSNQLSKQIYVAIVNNGTHYIAEESPVNSSKEYQDMVAKEAAFCILDRSPEGYMHGSWDSKTLWTGEIAHRFGKDAQKQLKFAFDSLNDEYRKHSMTTKLRPVQTARLVDGEIITMSVDGFVDKTGIWPEISAAPITKSWPVRVMMHLAPNHNWMDDSKFPLVVTSYEVQEPNKPQ